MRGLPGQAGDSEVWRELSFFAYREKFYVAKKRLKGAGATGFMRLGDLLATLTNGHTPLRHDLRVGDYHSCVLKR